MKRRALFLATLLTITSHGNAQTINNVGLPSYPSTPALLGGFNAQLQNAQDNILMFQGANVFASDELRNNILLGIGVFPGTLPPFDKLHLNDITRRSVMTRYTNASTGLTATSGFQVGIFQNGDGAVIHNQNFPIRFGTNNTEYMRILTNGNVGIHSTNANNSLEITSHMGNPYFGSATGSSGLRLSNLTSVVKPTVQTNKVLSVDANGDVILVNATGIGTNSATAKNGLNHTAGSPDIELGGSLVHHTNIGFSGFNQTWYGDGALGITDNVLAESINPIHQKVLIQTNKYRTAQRVENGNQSGVIALTGTDITVNGANQFSNTGLSARVSNSSYDNIGGDFIAGNLGFTKGRNNVGVQGYAYNAKGTNFGALGIASSLPNEPAKTNYGVAGIVSNGVDNFGSFAHVTAGPLSTNRNIAAINYVNATYNNQALVIGGLNYVHSYSTYTQFGSISGTSNTKTNKSVGVAGIVGYTNLGNLAPDVCNGTNRKNIAVYGGFGQPFDYQIEGNYAGYFNGHVYINGTATSPSGIFTTSDKRYKKEIKQLENVARKLKQINGYTYIYDARASENINFEKTEQIGLIAQELIQVFPQLVREDSEGFLSVNYQGLIPVLVEAYKEQDKLLGEERRTNAAQQKQIDELKTAIRGLADKEQKETYEHNIILGEINTIILNQNVPNPFTENTVIKYYVPSRFAKAQIIFSTIDGKIIKTVDLLTHGSGSLNVFTNDLSSGIYSYSLVVDGKTIDAKQMMKQ